jgi:hemerythrin-like domain-containing protein
MPDVLKLLEEDHKKVRKMLSELASTSDGAVKTREKLFDAIEREVKIHTTLEEEIFYPAFHKAVAKKEHDHLYYEALEEHHVVDMVLPEAEETDAGTPEFAAKAKVLKDLIEHHADEEEQELFPAARKVLDESEREALGEQLEARKQELMAEMS